MTAAQDLAIQWDAIGNLQYRHDHRNQSERFEYDARNRLLRTFDTTGFAPNGTGQLRREQTYDRAGNMLSKSDVGSYQYNSSRPHAGTMAGGQSYQYEVSGVTQVRYLHKDHLRSIAYVRHRVRSSRGLAGAGRPSTTGKRLS